MEPLHFREGYVEIPEVAGLGIEINEPMIKDHPLGVWRRPLVVEPDGNIVYQ